MATRGGRGGGAPYPEGLPGAPAAAEVSAGSAGRGARLFPSPGTRPLGAPALRSVRLPPDVPCALHLLASARPFLPPSAAFPFLWRELLLPLPFGRRTPGAQAGSSRSDGPPRWPCFIPDPLDGRATVSATRSFVVFCFAFHTLGSGGVSQSQFAVVSERVHSPCLDPWHRRASYL